MAVADRAQPEDRTALPGGEPAEGDRLGALAEEFLDRLLPRELPWRSVVVEHPLASVGLAAALGAWLGWTHGRRIVSAASDLLAAGVEERLARLLPESEEP